MIPLIQSEQIILGPLVLQTWGTLVALGFLIGAIASARFAKHRGLNHQLIYDLLGWIIVASIIGARLAHVFFYEPAYFLAHPVEIIAFWHGGLSIYGGFIGAIVAGVVFFRRRLRHQVTGTSSLGDYADATIFGLPLGLFIGRMGCFLIHDHPGTATDFWLGAEFPDGVVRHDLGLYDSLLGLGLFLIFLVMAKRKVPTGSYLVVFAIGYGIVRFLLDFLRVADATYFGLTPAQFLSVAMIAVGGYIYHRLSTKFK